MTLDIEKWNGILNSIEIDNNLSDVLEQVNAKLKERDEDASREWKQKGPDINHLFNVSRAISWGLASKKFTLLHKEECDVNRVTEDNDTALHYAAYKGHYEIVEYLAKKEGANINQAN